MSLLEESRASTTSASEPSWRPAASASRAPYVAQADQISVSWGDGPDWIGEFVVGLNQLLLLHDDWDTYGASPPRAKHALALLELLPRVVQDAAVPSPVLVPTARAGFQAEWERGGTVVELRVDDEVTSVYVEDAHGEDEGPAWLYVGRARAALEELASAA